MFCKLTPYVLWIFAACFTLAGKASADERWYDVELLVFKHAKAEHFLTEQWPTSWSIPDTGDSVDPIDIQKVYSKNFEKLPKEKQSFSGITGGMEKSSRYEILAYHGWRQKGLDKDEAVNIRVRAGKTYKKRSESIAGFPAATALSSEQQQAEGTLFEPVLNDNGSVIRHIIPQYIPMANTSDPGQLIYELDGNVKIVLSRFLHIYTDLLLLEPVDLKLEKAAIHKDDNLKTETDLVEETKDSFETESRNKITPAAYRLSLASSDAEFTTLHGFNIQSHRRMRSGEVHHLDHPLVGIIVKVTPSDLKI